MNAVTAKKSAPASKSKKVVKQSIAPIEGTPADESPAVVAPVVTQADTLSEQVRTILTAHPEQAHRVKYVVDRITAGMNGTQPPADQAPPGFAASIIEWK